MTLKIISAREILYTGEVSTVTLPGTMGEFTVLNNHASLLATLAAGTIRYTDAAGTGLSTEIGAGIADIDSNVITVCVY
ncbi:MAG: F0F1 ATP synthase subunit epsilon [Muribaculaceae bacterium]|nr:F0F1 ATP synthase subunit epsilon [Muribaculaceae bacterium]